MPSLVYGHIDHDYGKIKGEKKSRGLYPATAGFPLCCPLQLTDPSGIWPCGIRTKCMGNSDGNVHLLSDTVPFLEGFFHGAP